MTLKRPWNRKFWTAEVIGTNPTALDFKWKDDLEVTFPIPNYNFLWRKKRRYWRMPRCTVHSIPRKTPSNSLTTSAKPPINNPYRNRASSGSVWHYTPVFIGDHLTINIVRFYFLVIELPNCNRTKRRTKSLSWVLPMLPIRGRYLCDYRFSYGKKSWPAFSLHARMGNRKPALATALSVILL